MTTLNKKAIRRALEEVIRPALVTAGVCLDSTGAAAVQFQNLVLDKGEKLAEWVRFTVHFADDRLLGMGQNPLMQDSGMAFAMVYTAAGSGVDRNDTIVGIIEAAYPYNAVLTFGGVSVMVAETIHGDGALDGAWWAAPVKIKWNTWRNL